MNRTEHSTVTCPECGRPATVVRRFSCGTAGRTAEYLRIRCTGVLTFLVPAELVRRAAPRERPLAVA